MKYGDALPLRSVQEWLPYNLDYTEIKHLIKFYTTKNPPVANPNEKTDFENELFDVFMDQLERIDLFVKSKAGEIERRIANCERQVVDLQRRAETARGTAKIANRYAKVEQEVERAGHDVQSLSRFVYAQRTGFHKLLKKYRKWTGSAHLPDRFNIILESPTAFHRHNFDKSVIEVSELLTAVRDGINLLSDATFPSLLWQARDDVTHSTTHNPSQKNSDIGNRLELDTAFGISHITNEGGRAVFWVHNDHLIELQVFLLKHLTLQTLTPPGSLPSTPLISRRNSSVSAGEKGDDVGLVVLDDLGTFSNAQNTAVNNVSKPALRTAGQIRWCARDADAFVTVSDHSGANLDPQNEQNPEILEVKIKRKHVPSLIDPKTELLKFKDQSMSQMCTIERLRGWFSAHSEVAPLVKILSRRTRFTGTTPDGETWAFIDRDIRMFSSTAELDWLVSDDEVEGSKTVEFPHAVLEIQWDGKQPYFVNEICQSYMVEEIPGFSLDVHAIAVLHEPKNMPPPVWLSALKRDIRKTPSNRPMHSRRSSSRVVFSISSKNSSTVTGDSGQHDQYSTPGTSDGAMVTRKKKKRKNVKREIRSLSDERYWNEFDDEDREQPYTILMRPSTTESGYDHADQSLSAYISSPIFRALSCVWNIYPKKVRHPHEYPPLLGNSAGVDSESESDAEAGNTRPDYATFRTTTGRRTYYNNASHVGFLVVSFLMLVITGGLAIGDSLSGHKHKRKSIGKHIAIDLSALVGVLISLICAIVGVTIFFVGRSRAGLLHRVSVWMTFVVVCAGSGVLIVVLGRNVIEEGP